MIQEDTDMEMTCIDCKYWDEVMCKGHLRYRCINENSMYYMHDTGAVQQCAEFKKYEKGGKLIEQKYRQQIHPNS